MRRGKAMAEAEALAKEKYLSVCSVSIQRNLAQIWVENRLRGGCVKCNEAAQRCYKSLQLIAAKVK